MIKELQQSRLFFSLTAEQIQSVLQNIEAKESFFSKGEIVALENEPCNRLIILLKGSVKAEMTDPLGKVVKVEDIYAPNPLAILFLFGGQNRFPVQIISLTDTVALVIPKQSVFKMLTLNDQILKNYLDISADYASVLSQKLHLMSFRTITQKLIIYILHLIKDDSLSVKMDRSQSALAEYFGVSRPALARVLRNMQDVGLITVVGREIKILDKSKLTQLVDF